jgi:hypothetical protein
VREQGSKHSRCVNPRPLLSEAGCRR